MVVVQGQAGDKPLKDGSIICLLEDRTVLGKVRDIFGPVTQPFYQLGYRAGLELKAGPEVGGQIELSLPPVHLCPW